MFMWPFGPLTGGELGVVDLPGHTWALFTDRFVVLAPELQGITP